MLNVTSNEIYLLMNMIYIYFFYLPFAERANEKETHSNVEAKFSWTKDAL